MSIWHKTCQWLQRELNPKRMWSDEFFRVGSWLMIVGVAGTAMNIVFRIVMGRLLSTEEYGVMDTMIQSLAIIGVPASAAMMAINHYVARSIAVGDRHIAGAILWRAMKKLGIYAGAVVLLIVLAAGWIQNFFSLSSPWPVYVTGAIFLTSLVWTVWSGGLHGAQRFIASGGVGVAGAAARLTVAAVLVWLGCGASGALAGTLAANIAMIALGAVVLKELLASRARGHIDTGPIYRYLWPLLFVLWFRSLLGNFDIIAVKHFFTPEEAGVYARVTTIGRNVVGLSGPFMVVLFPKVADGNAQGKKTAHLLGASIKYGLLLCLAGAAFCALFPQVPILALHGRDFLWMSTWVRWVTLAFIPINIAGFVSSYLLGLRDFRFLKYLIPAALSFVTILWLYHPSVGVVLMLVALGGLLCLAACCAGVWEASRRPLEPHVPVDGEGGWHDA